MSQTKMLLLMSFFLTIPATSAIIGAIYLMVLGKAGWGWLIFAAIIIGSYTVNFEKKENAKNDLESQKTTSKI